LEVKKEEQKICQAELIISSHNLEFFNTKSDLRYLLAIKSEDTSKTSVQNIVIWTFEKLANE